MKIIFTITFIIIFSSLVKSQNTACKFDSTELNENFIKNIKLNYYEWNNNFKQAKIITKDGNFLFIKKWACETKGTIARLIVFNDYDLTNEDITTHFEPWLNLIIETGKQLLEKEEFIKFNEFFQNPDLTSKEIGHDLVFELPSKKYQVFVVDLSIQDKLIIINILFYEK